MACWVSGIGLAGCVFTPPPPLPEELAEQEAEAARRAKSLHAGEAADPEAGGGGQGSQLAFEPGDEPALGMSPEEMKAYAKAQGDPAQGTFTLEEALHGLPSAAEGPLMARFLMTDGRVMSCELFEQRAPVTVANFVGLARGFRPTQDPETGEWTKVRFYDGTQFHRVIPGFMIQGGDRTGTGRGNTGYVIPDEFRDDLRHDEAGVLSMANRGPGTGSGQFFMTLAPTPHLDGKHTVFGKCDEAAIEVAEAIAATAGPDDRPTEPQSIDTIEIVRGKGGTPAAPVSPVDEAGEASETPAS